MERELTLEEIHEELMCQLRDILAVCERHGIEYNLMCGTLLGAVRHKGFIPWDDDVDLLMTRGEFTKFREVYPKECDQRFELTYLDTWTPRVMNLLHLHLLQGMMKKNVDYSRFGLKNRILLHATHVLGMPFSYAWKAKRYEKVSTRIKTGNDLHMSNGAFELMTHVWHPEQFAEKIRVPFEDVECLIPKKYDEVLTILFGPDYMTPPPEAERVAKHLDL